MKKFLDEFKEFINQGNVVAVAVAFVMAMFFTPIIDAIVNGIILNLIAAIFGKPNFDSITIGVGDAELLIGTVITAVVQFLIVAVVLFLIVKAYEQWRKEDDEVGPNEIELLTEIRDALRNR